MLKFYVDEAQLICNKCGNVIRNATYFDRKVLAKYYVKKSYCGKCVQERIHKNDPNYDFFKEFSYSEQENIAIREYYYQLDFF